MIRYIIGVVVGLAVGVAAVTIIEGISSLVYPRPENLDFYDSEAVASFIATLPVSAFLLVLAAHAVGAFVAALVCVAIVRRSWWIGAVILGSLLMIGGVSNLAMIPHPLWFSVADLAVYLPSALAGGMLAHSAFGRPKSESSTQPAGPA